MEADINQVINTIKYKTENKCRKDIIKAYL